VDARAAGREDPLVVDVRTAMLARLLPLALALASPLAAQAADYVVLAAFAADDAFDAAARVLADGHKAEIVRFDPADLEPVRAKLVAKAPRHVALVMRPEQIDFAFQRRFLQLATELDDDPFVDFAFGYVTGRTAADAEALGKRGLARKAQPLDVGLATVIGGTETSLAQQVPQPGRLRAPKTLQILCAGEKAFPEAGRDRDFLRAHLPELTGRDAITFVGHGYPREVVGGPTFAELAGLDLGGAVVLNVACYTGVTNRWFEDDWQNAVVRARDVPPDESFCLALLRTGVVGYTAYLCPRPAGPELDTDLAALLAGSSLGDARRRDYDKTVLGFLGFGEQRLQLAAVAEGTKFAPNREAVRDIMLEGATGGALFGDPECVPFADDAVPPRVKVEVEAKDDALVVKARADQQGLWLQCADPTATWGKTMAMRVYARVPLGDRHVSDVVVDELVLGSARQPSRVLWAVERDRGERFLQLKVNFPRPDMMAGALRMIARVTTTVDARLGKLRGGDVQRPRVASKDVRSRVLEPYLVERGAARDVSREVLQEALDASAHLLGDPAVDASALAKFTARGSEGFRAACALLEVGHAHFRTWQLCKATWQPGDERHLLALASGDELPNQASWCVLESLGAADTVEVRAYLLKRLEQEQDAGLFMSAAAGLAHLGAREAVPVIGARLREVRAEWQGVAPHLISSLAELGGAEAVQQLEALGRDERCRDVAHVLRVLDQLDAEAGKRVRDARGK
jgi:hypothetical protein